MELYELVRDRIDDPSTHFVFPSELTARFWCKRSLKFSTHKSIPAIRFLSWDQFKQSCFVYASPGRPVNRAVRLLFIDRLLEINRRSPFLRQIIPPQYAAQPLLFLESLQRLLPVLHRTAGIRARWPRFSRDKLADLEGLHARYREFLTRSQLYEPSYEQPRYSPGKRRFLIFFPELIEDFGEYSEELSNQVELVPVPPDIRRGTSVRLFQTLPEEIRAAIRQSAALLDKGVDPQQIVLTVGQLSELEPLLRREAELFCLPLQFHLGKPLSEFPQITLLHKTYEAVQSSLSLDAMKALLLCRSIPWKQEKLCRALIRLALDCRIAGNTAEADNWAACIESSRNKGNPRRLPLSRISGFYSTLRHQLLRIGAATTFSELKSCLVSFTADFLDLKRLDEEEVKVFQFAMDTLDELEQADELISSGVYEEAPSGTEAGSMQRPAFQLWWLYLGQRLYVPGRYTAGIPVFPFRVSAGMDPEYHFVINASQAATSHTIHRYPFLKLHEEQDFYETQRELAPAHLQLYSHSGGSVMFSYARRDFHRSNLPPPLFLSRDVPVAEITDADTEDAYNLERRAWIFGTSFPLQEIQKIGFEAAAGALEAKDIDATGENLKDKGLIRTLEGRLRDAEGRFRISATALERFSLCPFQFLWERLLGIWGEEYEPPMIDPMELGNLMHRALELFFVWVKSEESGHSGALSLDRREEYRERLEDIVSAICSEYRRRNPTLLSPIAAEIHGRVKETILTFLDVELEMMSGERVEGIEFHLEAAEPEIDAVLVGAIDRTNRNPGGYTLIDYKKKQVPSRRELFSSPALSLQMPFYIHLMEQNDRSVTRAAYYSFENKRYHFVFGGPKTNMASPEEAGQSVEEVKRRIVEMRERMSAGNYRIGSSPEANCSRCRLLEICRGGYTLNR